MPRKAVDLKRWLVPKLRRASMFWPSKSVARERARVEVQDGFFKNGKEKFKVMYQCAHCEQLVEKTDSQMDHIVPVVDVEGFSTWDEYIRTLFCDESNYQCLCKACHFVKTQAENITRAENKKLKKSK